MDQLTTVLGPVAGQDLGVALTHEHLFINLTREFRVGGLLNDVDVAHAEVAAFRAVGGGTIVDVTSAEVLAGAAPDPGASLAAAGLPAPASRVEALRSISAATGVHIVVSTGHYRDPYLDREWFDRFDPDAIAAGLIRDIRDGIGDTGVRAGLIGEIGSDRWYISAAEERSFRAAARAHHETGVAITTHAARWPVGLPQLDLLASEGVPAQAVIVGHCDQINSPEYHAEVARRGAWVSFDCVRGNDAHQTRRRVEHVRAMVEGGWRDHLLLSHDVCRTEHLRAHGGNGFCFVPTSFRELLVAAGVAAADVDAILVDNPRRALCR